MTGANDSTNANLDALWTPKELGAYLKVSRSWIYRACQKNTIPFLNAGGLLRFEPSKIHAWVQANAAQPARCLE